MGRKLTPPDMMQGYRVQQMQAAMYALIPRPRSRKIPRRWACDVIYTTSPSTHRHPMARRIDSGIRVKFRRDFAGAFAG